MHLANEAAYLYLLSKELVSLNKQLKKSTAKAEKHLRNQARSKTEDERRHHRLKHARTTIEITHLMKKHNELLDKLRYHHLAFNQWLSKEHRI